jgi:hypothetical protein
VPARGRDARRGVVRAHAEARHDDRGLHVARRREQARRLFRFDLARGHDDAAAAVAQLGVGLLHVHHQVPVDLAQAGPWPRW